MRYVYYVCMYTAIANVCLLFIYLFICLFILFRILNDLEETLKL